MKLSLDWFQRLSRSSWLTPPPWRLIALVAGSVVVLGIAIAGVWLWFAAEQRRGLEAFAEAMVKLQTSQAPNAAPDAKEAALRDLERALSERPPAGASAQVTYELGNLKYSAQQYPSSRSAYEMTAGGVSPTLRRLSQVSVGYTWEAEKDYPKAADAYETAAASLKPGDFLYDELLMDLGRVQELAGRKDAAIRTYQRIADDPKSFRRDDARGRLASLTPGP
jgi:tetratricopeptide (TPR) repeat protein